MKKVFALLTIITFILTGCIHKDESIIKKTFVCKEQINSLNVNDIDSSIKLKISKDDDIHVNYWEGNKNKYKIETKESMLKIDKIESKNKYLSLENRYMEIEVPDKIYKIIDIKSDNGNIKFEKIYSNQIVAESNNGDIDVDLIGGNDIKLCSKNGDINGTINENQDQFDIENNVENGNSNLNYQLKNKGKKLYIESLCGNVMINFNK